ncbi:MAG: ISNCY family transposase [Candidatus Dormibacteraeota bacterium]|nr:ISNCY family transposase [Candidatus Dormibacteraeota bacterium]
MTGAEQRRLMILNQVAAGVLLNAEAANLLGLSVRQLQRIRAAYRETGALALAHGNRGRRPSNGLASALVARVVELATTKYVGFNQHHLTEMLSEHEGLTLSRPTVHRILKAAGVPAARKRRPQRHRRRRDRYPRPGMLLQIDGSRHDWLEGRGPWLTLVGGIDDATGLVPWAGFREQEDAQGYFELLRAVVRRYGIPLALYSDRHGIFFKTKDQHLTLEEELTARREPTQFGRLLEELGIELILARTPQAKGRVERLWGTFQDRLASELRLAGAGSAAEADQVLARYLPRHNRRFTVPANDPTPAWLPWPKGQRLDDLFCFKYRRVVANDHTVRLRSQVIDIPPTRARLSFAKVEVELHERFDGTLRVYYQGSCLATKVLDQAKPVYRVDQHSQATDSHEPRLLTSDPIPVAPAAPWRPAVNHPWRSRAVQPK